MNTQQTAVVEAGALRRGFGGHLLGQACEAVTDNIYRGVFKAIAVGALGGAAVATVSEKDAALTSALLGLAFLLPFVLLAPTAGSLSDRLPKRTIMVTVRLCEPVLCSLAALAVWWHSEGLMFAAIALLGAMSAFFSPVKYAVIPELVADKDLEGANGRLQALSNLAIVGGIVLAGLVDPGLLAATPLARLGTAGVVWILALLFCGLGLSGTLRIPRLPAQNPGRRLASPLAMREQLAVLRVAPGLVIPAVCLAAFWALAAICDLAMANIAAHTWHLGLIHIAGLNVVMALGLALGSELAPRLIVRAYPAGAPMVGAFVAGASVLFAALVAGYPGGVAGASGPWAFAAGIFLAGLGGGLWMVPLNVLLQERAPASHRGLVFSASNLVGTLGLIGGFLVVGAAGQVMAAWQVFGLVGAAIVAAAIAFLHARYARQSVAWLAALAVRLLYRVKVEGDEHLPATGGCLVVCNHVAYADGPILFACLSRPGRFLVWKKIVDRPIVGFPLRAAGVIPVDGDNPNRALIASMEAATEAARRGEVVVIFPEGKLTRNGHLHRFNRGMERIARAAGVPIVPAWLEGLHGDWSSRAPRRDRFRLRRPITLVVGAPLDAQTPAGIARQAVVDLSFRASLLTSQADGRDLATATLAVARRHPRSLAVADAQGRLDRLRLCGVAKVLVPALGLADDEARVGILLPPGRGGAVANLALLLAGRCTVNLNHTVGAEGLAVMGCLAGLRTILTSKIYHRRIGEPALPGRVLYLEDLLPALPKWRVLLAMAGTLLLPLRLQHRSRPDAVAALVFSSGSTGVPKGVQLTHRQLLASCRAMVRHLDLHPGQDVVLTPLPLFHSFGLSVGLHLGLAHGLGIAGQADPTDGAALGALAQATRGSFLISTPTFVRGYLRRVSREQFAHLRLAVVGAERCPAELRAKFSEAYGAPLLEGYGCTELAPVVSVNVPDSRRDGEREEGQRDGTVGRALPGVSVVAMDVDSRQILPPDREGLLVVRSPARMLGYLDRDDLTQKAFVHDGYDTGDIGRVDADGFITITGRLARFAKVGGEMVPLDKVEADLSAALRVRHPDAEFTLAVAAVRDESRGERLLVLHTGLPCTATDLAALAETLPPLFRPKARDVHQVEALPSLGSGKRDLKALREMAERIAAG